MRSEPFIGANSKRSVGFGLLLATAVFFAGPGCTRKESANITSPGDLSNRADALYRDYLTNDFQGAKQSIENCLRLLMESSDRAYADANMWLGYARLFSIESASGRPDVATVYYEKCKYYYLVSLERAGKDTATIVQSLNLFTPEKCRNDVLEWDRAFTGGKGARYHQTANE